jgi:transposase-like protein
MSEEGSRVFSREFKLSVLERMAAGENVSALARELGVRRKCLYQWRERYRLGGEIAVRSRGRPTKAEALAIRAAQGVTTVVVEASAPAAPARLPNELAQAQARIAELERKVGQQQVDIDFFQQALRHVREQRRRSGAPGGTTSTRSSKR